MRRVAFFVMVAVMTASVPAEAGIRSAVRRGNGLYRNGAYADAAEAYKKALARDAESPIVHFNLGAALYKEGDYPAAVEHFQKALLDEDEGRRETAHFNLGNALYRAGSGFRETAPVEAAGVWRQAVTQYEQALALDPEDEDARFNRDIVKRMIEELEQRQQDSSQQRSSDSTCDRPQGEKEQSSPGEKQGAKEYPATSGGQKETPQGQGSETQERPDRGEEGESGAEAAGASQDAEGSSSSADPREMSPSKAEMTLRQYHQDEEPKELLDLQRVIGEQPVSRDW